MHSFKNHLITTRELDSLRFTASKPSIKKRIDEGISRFEIGLDDVYVSDPPTNSSKVTKYEIEELAKLSRGIVDRVLIEAPIREMLDQVFVESSVYVPEPTRKRLFSVLYDVKTTCLALQYEHRRVRPRVIAESYGVTLPDTYKALENSPSYPSTRSTQLAFLALYLGERFAGIEPHITDLSQRVDDSLMRSCLHYRSDIDASHELARYLFTATKRKL